MQILFSAKKTFCDRQNKFYFKIVLLINAQQMSNFNWNHHLNIKYVQEFQIHELPLYNNIMYISYFFDLQDEKIPSEGRSNQNMCYWWFFRLDSPLFNRYTLSCYYLKALDICFFRFNNECKTSKSCSTLAPFIMRTLRVIYNLKYYYFR